MTDRTAPAKEARSEPLVTDEVKVLMLLRDATALLDDPRGDAVWQISVNQWMEHLLAAKPSIVALQSRRSSPVREGDGVATPKTASHPSPTSSAWRPIETAPKDGTRILIARFGENVGPDEIEITEWFQAEHDTYEPVEGDLYRKKRETYHEGWNGNGHRATHWMPLPAPPEAESLATHEMGAERSGASPSLSPSEPSGRGESGGILPTESEASMNKEEKK